MYQWCDGHVFVQEEALWCTKGVMNMCLYRRWRSGVRTETESLRLMKVVHRPEACMKDNA